MSSPNDKQDISSGLGKKREHVTTLPPTNSNAASDPKPVSKSHLSKVKNDDNTPSNSPPNKKLTSMKDLIEANDAAQNLALFHEINLDEQFKLPEPNMSTEDQDPATMTAHEKLESAVKEAMHKAFWDSLSADLNANPPVFKHAFVLLEEIKGSFLSLLPTDRVTSLHKRIQEGLDMDLLKQQAEHNALDIRALTGFLIDTMAMMCAPVRDEEVAQLRSLDSIVDLFKGIYKVLEMMTRDFANYSISAYRPLLQKHHIEYERQKFSEILAKLPDGLRTTEQWLRSCHEELQDDMDLRASPKPAHATSTSNPSPTPTLSPTLVLKRAFLKLLHWEEGKEFPETVLVDQARFYQLQVELKRILMVAASLLTTFTALRADLASHQAFVKTLKEELFVLFKPVQLEKNLTSTLEGVAEQIFYKTSDYIKTLETPSELSSEQKTAFSKQIKSIEEQEAHPVYRVLLKRAHEYLYATAEYKAQRKSATSNGNALATPPGLQVVSKEFESLAATYSKLVNLNQIVYGPFYAPILREALDLPKTPSYSPISSPRDPNPRPPALNSIGKKPGAGSSQDH